VCLGTDAANRTIGCEPRESHGVDKHWDTSQSCGTKTSISKEFLCATANISNRVDSYQFAIRGLEQRSKVNVTTSEPMKVGLRELDNDGGNGSEFSHGSWSWSS
jgi:hypothetical protein